MPSTFFGLTISASGLNTSQAQVNTTANNISNVRTEGYSRQVVNTVASSALRCYQTFGTVGTGVEAVSITQHRDLYYDEKYWNNQAELGFYEKKQYYMDQIQTYFSETNSTTGFNSIYGKLFNSMSGLTEEAGTLTNRKQFISDAKELMTYFNGLSTKLKQLQSSVNDEIKTAVDEVNAIAEKIAILNKQINIIEQGGSYANELRDQRALLVDELSEYATTEVSEMDVVDERYPKDRTGATYYTVYFNGQLLVDTYEFDTLKIQAREKDEAYNQCDVEGLYDIVWEKEGNRFEPVNRSNSGSIKSMFEVRDGNNGENMKGRVYEATSNSITIDHLSEKDINELNLAATGAIFCNGKEYTYGSFEITTDAEGKMSSIKFNLSGAPLSTTETVSLKNKELECGSTVEFMGIAYYQNQMSIFLRNFCEQFNKLEHQGLDKNGDPMGSFFVANAPESEIELTMTDMLVGYEYETTTDSEGHVVPLRDEKGDIVYKKDADGNLIPTGTGTTLKSSDNFYYRLTAANAAIAFATDKDSNIFATKYVENKTDGVDEYGLLRDLEKLRSEATIFRGGSGQSFLECMYADITVDTQESTVFTKNYTNIKETISQQRQSVSGVDEDEEALDLIKFQNAYNLNSKCISVFTEIYDRLILQTGV